MKNKEIEELLNMLKKCAREDKATLKLNEIACKTILSYIEQLEKRNKQLYEGFMATIEELTEYATKNEQLEKDKEILIRNNNIGNERLKELQNINKQLENNRDKAIEVINTQLKNAEGGLKDNLRIIKFNLIKGSCTFEDLKTEEDYKYILKGDSDE